MGKYRLLWKRKQNLYFRLDGGGRSVRLPGGSDIFSKSVKLMSFQSEARVRVGEDRNGKCVTKPEIGNKFNGTGGCKSLQFNFKA